MSKILYFGIRGYVQADGGYRAVATVERAGVDGKVATRTEFSSVHADAMVALAEALELVKFQDEETST